MGKHTRINLDREPADGQVFIDVASGVEGPALYVGDNNYGRRIAGPKPWGGGTTLYRFPVSVSALREALAEHEAYKARQATATGETSHG